MARFYGRTRGRVRGNAVVVASATRVCQRSVPDPSRELQGRGRPLTRPGHTPTPSPCGAAVQSAGGSGLRQRQVEFMLPPASPATHCGIVTSQRPHQVPQGSCQPALLAQVGGGRRRAVGYWSVGKRIYTLWAHRHPQQQAPQPRGGRLGTQRGLVAPASAALLAAYRISQRLVPPAAASRAAARATLQQPWAQQRHHPPPVCI